MKLSELKAGGRFKYADAPNGGEYVKGGRVPSINEAYYVHGPVYIYMGSGNDEVIKVEEDKRAFTVINTTEYNDDGKWSVQTVRFDRLEGLGFDQEEIERIDGLNVSGILNDFDFNGVIVIRVA